MMYRSVVLLTAQCQYILVCYSPHAPHLFEQCAPAPVYSTEGYCGCGSRGRDLMAVELREGSGGCGVEGGIWWLWKLMEDSGGFDI